MEENIIVPTGQGGTLETKKLVGGWNAMKNGNVLSRQERLIKEQEEKAQRIKSGKPAVEQDNNYKPGQDGDSTEFSVKNARKFIQTLTEEKKTQRVFKGSSEQCIMKIGLLLGGIQNESGISQKGKILLVEEAGINQYKITYILT